MKCACARRRVRSCTTRCAPWWAHWSRSARADGALMTLRAYWRRATARPAVPWRRRMGFTWSGWTTDRPPSGAEQRTHRHVNRSATYPARRPHRPRNHAGLRLRPMPIVPTVAGHLTRSRTVVTHHRHAKRSLECTGSVQSRHGLDWMNFFTADVQLGFGAFVSFYLAGLGWSQESVGFAMTVGQLTGAVVLIPGGALADALRWKRGLAATGLVMIACAALILALEPSFALVVGAEFLEGASAGLIGPAIAAISLGIVGRRAMSARTGRNERFQAAGSALTGLLMGALGSYFGAHTIFLVAAALSIPALIALDFIRSDEIDHARARNAETQAGAPRVSRIPALGKNRQLMWFTGCLAMFQLADASMLPLR